MQELFIDFFTNPWTITVGGGVLVLLISYYGFGIGRSHLKNSPDQISEPEKEVASPEKTEILDGKDSKSKSHSKLEAIDIVNDVNNNPPYRRSSAGESYVGRKVSWNVVLHRIHPKGENSWYLMMLPDDCKDSGFPWVYCTVKQKDYPELKTVHEDVFRVEGRICSVDGHDIRLEESKLHFD